MIPARLRLRNFLSYRECELDLQGLELAVLCGKNGDGKSALLDAMVWALWGEGRGKTEDDRIHHAETAMLVEFEFDVGAERFLVIRKRTRAKGSSLDLFQLTPDGGRTALSGGTMRETQAEITRRARMDYKTFANSAFVAQGHADEFTQQGPKERKEVFRKILGLDRYELLATAAHERRKEAAAGLKALQQNTDAASAEVARLPEVEAELVQLTSERAELQPRIVTLDAAAGQLQEAAASFERLQGELDAAVAARAAAEAAMRQSEAEVALVADDLARVRATIAAADGVAARHAELGRLRVLLTEQDDLQQKALALEARANRLERTIGEEQARIEAKATALAAEVTAALKLAATLPALEAEDEGLAAEAEGHASAEAEVAGLRTAATDAAGRAAHARAAAGGFRDQATGLKAKQEQLDGAALCPVCRGPLGPDELRRVQEEYADERRVLGTRYKEALADADEADHEGAALGERIRVAQAALKARQDEWAARRRDIHGRLMFARRAGDETPPKQEALAELRRMLDEGRFALDERGELAQVRAACTELAYDADTHTGLRAKVQELAPAEDAYRQLMVASEREAALEEHATRADVARREKAGAVTDAATRWAAADAALADMEDVRPRLAAARQDLAEARLAEADLIRQQGNAEARRDHLRELQARLEEALAQAAGLKDEELVMTDLAHAFGRDGVQAMLIDQSLPEVELVANHILDLMTGGRIHIVLSTQRANARGTVETLDIRISDELGTRDYEMYSGGEAFRVDFALRIALAKLLAARSGADLPTLIIDEGFGSQDNEGIDRLVEAINSIRHEFKLILVVTHVDDMKERFERRIEVSKDPVRGSLARIV